MFMTVNQRVLGSSRGALGRAVPIAGWALTGYDMVMFMLEDPNQFQSFTGKCLCPDDYDPSGFPRVINCFVEGTIVNTPEGFIPIEEIEKGQVILSMDIETGTVEHDIVESSIHSDAEVIFRISLESGETVMVTSEHPFYLSDRKWVKASNIKVGDLLVDMNNEEVAVVKIEQMEADRTVYNIQVRKNENYFVSRSKVLVHNKNINHM